MDVPYTSSGASSASHYSLVRNVENAKSARHAERLLTEEKERIRRRLSAKNLSPSELRKELIILLYCLNTSSGSLTSESLHFALPSAVHLAEAGGKASEKYIGYLFCTEVMPTEHELALMLVNTLRKDITSSAFARIDLALNMLISFPSADVIPAVQARVMELLSHPSPRIKVLALNAYLSLARLSPDMLQDGTFVQLVVSRLDDGEESVIRAALETCLQLASDGILNKNSIIDYCSKLIHRFSEKRSARRGSYSTSFRLSVLTIFRSLGRSNLDHLNGSGFCMSVLTIIRRAVRANEQSLVLEAFRMLGQIPTAVVNDQLGHFLVQRETSNQTTPNETGTAGETEQRVPVGAESREYHPVAQIRHYLSSQSLTDHYLFLSCLTALDPSLWAGAPSLANEASGSSATVEPILDQWEVERIMGFLESGDSGIRGLTIKLLGSQSGLLDVCYTRAVDALRQASTSDIHGPGRARALELSIELAFAASRNSSDAHDCKAASLVAMLKDIAAISEGQRSDYVDGLFVQQVLIRARTENSQDQRAFLLSLSQVVLPDNSEGQSPTTLTAEMNTTLLLTFLALLCELSSLFETKFKAGEKPDAYIGTVTQILVRAANLAEKAPASVQESVVLCMSRLVLLLPLTVLLSNSDDDQYKRTLAKTKEFVRSICDEASRRLPNKACGRVVKRCEQFFDICINPRNVQATLEGRENVPLPEFAVLLDNVGSTDTNKMKSPRAQATSPGSSLPSSPPRKITSLVPSPTLSPTRTNSSSRLAHSKLRYAAYEPPAVPVTRFGREHKRGGVSGASLGSQRSSSRMSDLSLDRESQGSRLAGTITPGELALAANMEILSVSGSGGGKQDHHVINSPINQPKPIPDRVIIDAFKKLPDANLIALDSPFINDPFINPPSPVSALKKVSISTNSPAPPMELTLSKGASSSQPSPYVSANTSLRTTPEPDNGQLFEAFWNTFAPGSGGMSARGWCEDPVEDAVRKLQTLSGIRMDVLPSELGPFLGDLKILIRSQGSTADSVSSSPCALVRLHEEDDGSCLWQARGNDASYMKDVKSALS